MKRYKEIEAKEPNFIENGNSKKHIRDVFFFVYYAGHGCADVKQYFVLNEKEADKIFWPAEQKLRLMATKCGSGCKLFVVYDCCREDIVPLRIKVEKSLFIDSIVDNIIDRSFQVTLQ